jgi:biotin transport system substrate-specific component
MSIKEHIKSNLLLNFISSHRASQVFWILSFSVFTAIGAQIAIPVNPVPFTLQTMIVLLAGALLGPKNGAYSQLVYLAAGAVGLPIYAGGTLGAAILFGPTGGYLLAFPLGAYLTGYLVQNYKSYVGVVLSMFAGNILIILMGTSFLFTFYLHDFEAAIIAGAAIFTIWMVVKMFVGATIYFTISKKYETLP